MTEKIIRDPVHDVIAFRLDRPLEVLLFKLINADEFQRLRRIRQLGMAHLAYPGADHSRYSHSLGVMETARKIIDQLRGGVRIDPEQEMLCITSALLHDLGHGPFSHVFERVSGIHHESLTQRVILDPDSQVHRILSEHDAQLPSATARFLRRTPQATFYNDIVSSQLDADRFDYLLRDNLMTGSRYGNYDLAWLLHALTVDEMTQRLAVTRKGVSAVEAYLQARYHMYRNVYFHKVVRSAEGMLRLALQRARELASQDRLEWPGGNEGIHKALLGQELTMQELTDLDDVSILHCFKIWTHSTDSTLANLCRGMQFRQVFKTIDLSSVGQEAAISLVESAQQVILTRGGDPAYEMFYDEPEDTPYKVDDLSDEILVRDEAGRMSTLASVSPMTQGLNRQLMFRRLHVLSVHKQAIIELEAFKIMLGT